MKTLNLVRKAHWRLWDTSATRSYRVAAAILAMLLLYGCASDALLRSPVDGQMSKATESSKNEMATRFVRWPLTFVSDFDLQPEHPLVEEMVQLRERVTKTLSFDRPEEPIQVFLYQDDARYEAFWKERFPNTPVRRAVFLETPVRKALYIHWGDKAAEDVRHEVTHGYLHSMAPAIPLWLDEGLAEYFETPETAEGKNAAHIALLKRSLKDGSWEPNLKRLEQMTDMAQMRQIDYAESWLWTYWLLHTEREKREFLGTYLKSVRFNHDPGSMHTELEVRLFNVNESLKGTLDRL